MLQELKNVWHFFEALTASCFFRFPSRKLLVIGVTGTDGKTTTVNLIYHILTESGYKTAVISTLSFAHTTTPDSWKLQKFLSLSRRNGCTHAVLEVSSHAIDQHRIFGVNFAIGVLTNIADNEHIDYHGTFENYRQAKMDFLLSCPVIVANGDDGSFPLLKSRIATQELISYPGRGWSKRRYKTKLLGEFSYANILAAASVARKLGISERAVAAAVASFRPLRGRMEIVARRPFLVIVDFAHTPQAFAAVLPVARGERQEPNNKLIHVFGATGERDKSKRAIMARIAADNDDYVYLTHEDTYREDPKSIIAQLEQGLMGARYRTYKVVFDRREAIKRAIEKAKSGDVVILTGVGHQRSMNIAGKEIPWNEAKIARDFARQRARKLVRPGGR